MSGTTIRQFRLSLQVVLVMAAGASVARAQAAFVFSEPLKQTLSTAPSSDVIQVFVSAPKPVVDPRMTIVQLKGPGGELLPPTALRVEGFASSPLSTGGDRFTMRIGDAGAFRVPGDYIVLLRFAGTVAADDKTEPVAQLTSLTLTAPSPALDVSRHQNSIVRLWRSSPFSSAAGTVALSFEETSGKADVADLVVQREALFRKGTMELATGTVELAKDTNGAGGVGITLKAGRQREITLVLNGLDAGTFTTGVGFSSPSLTGRPRLAFEVQVADNWPYPLIVITVGVVVGAFIRYLADVRRPLQQARYRLEFLRAEIDRWLERVRETPDIQKLDDLQEQLRTVDLRLDLRDATGATTILDSVEKELREFRTAWDARLKDVRGKLLKTRARHDALRALVTAANKPDEMSRFKDAGVALDAAELALEDDEIGAAEARTADAAAGIAALEVLYPPPSPTPASAAAAAPDLSVVVRADQKDLIAGRNLTFEATAASSLGADAFRWEFGDGHAVRRRATQVRHRYAAAGDYSILVTALRNDHELATAALALKIDQRPAERLVVRARAGLRLVNTWLTAVSVVIAVATGMGVLYFGATFATPQQYLAALLWGIGIDGSVKTIAEVMRKF